jgi:glutamyl-tRNA(Gln) amidotransferase subunit E (EC 6.3.5.7)
VPPTQIASLLLNTARALAREGVDVTPEKIESVLAELDRGTITKEAVEEILRSLKEGESALDAAKRLGLVKMPYEEVKRVVEGLVKEVGPDKALREAMRRYRGRIDSGDVARALKEIAGGN